MKYPDNLLYSKSHEWLQELEDGSVLIGITAYAAEQMGGVVYVDLPEADDEAELGESFAEAESVKAVSEIISPVSGVISVVNQDLEDQPNLLNDSPYDAWIVRVSDVSEREELMDAAAYEAFVAE
ncbi:MAG: glycine cleavage system protein GcvH [Clostridia bacterium]|nr:glycine cleavage system protein GcvH [Clostridia bacterium]NLF20818.1 glycine cleavage system protein GcvH [Clostridiaceae bacterium]